MTRKLAGIVCFLVVCPSMALARRGDVLKRVEAPSSSVVGLATGDKCLWAAERGDGVLWCLDSDDGHVLRKVPSPTPWPSGVAWGDGRLFVIDPLERRLFVVTPDTGDVVAGYELESKYPRGAGWRKGRLFIGDDFTDRIEVVDPSDGTTIRRLPAPDKGTSGLGFYRDDVLVVADRSKDRLYFVDPDLGRVYFWLASPGPHPVGVARLHADLLVADYGSRSMAVVEVGSRPRVVTWKGKELFVDFLVAATNLGPGKARRIRIAVAVPGDAVFQKVLSVDFDPSPTSFVKEGDTRVALFSFQDVAPGASVTARMRARVVLKGMRALVLPGEPGDHPEFPRDVARQYTRDGKKLMLRHRVIRSAAKDIAKRSRGLLDLVWNTYEFVIRSLHYELAGGWNAAPMVLKRGSGSCSEYSFLLVALLRANGIPARFAGSIAVRGDDASWDEVFHRWVEVYLPGLGFVPLDANKGDRKMPAKRASGFLQLEPRYLVTTRVPGGGDQLGWTYNYKVKYQCEGSCQIKERAVAEWRKASGAGSR